MLTFHVEFRTYSSVFISILSDRCWCSLRINVEWSSEKWVIQLIFTLFILLSHLCNGVILSRLFSVLGITHSMEPPQVLYYYYCYNEIIANQSRHWQHHFSSQLLNILILKNLLRETVPKTSILQLGFTKNKSSKVVLSFHLENRLICPFLKCFFLLILLPNWRSYSLIIIFLWNKIPIVDFR